MSEDTPCAKRVFTGQRWDFGGHACQGRGVVREDGKWWCKRHAPSAVALRVAALDRKYERKRAVSEAEWEVTAAERAVIQLVRAGEMEGLADARAVLVVADAALAQLKSGEAG